MLFVQNEQKHVLKRTMQQLGDVVFEAEEGHPDEGWEIQTAKATLNSPATVWTDLPEFVLEQVVVHVQADRASSVVFRQVCRAWREAHDRHVSVLAPKCVPPQDALAWRHFAAIKTLLLSAHVVNDGVFIALAASFPPVSLTSLSLGRFFANRHEGKKVVPSVTYEGIKAIARLTTLTSLELNHCEGVRGNTGVRSLAALTALTRLSLAGCTNIPRMEELMTPLAPLTVLSSLSVRNCYAAVAEGGVSALGLHTSLTSLDVGGCSLTDAGLIALASLTALKSLSMWQCCDEHFELHLTDLGVAALASLTQLTSLNLGHCLFGVTDVGVTPLASLTALTSLNLHGCKKMTEEGIIALAPVLTNLTSLELHYCEMSDVGVTALAGLTALTSLDLGSNSKLTDEGIMVLVPVLTRLTHLELSWCNKMTDAGVTALAGGLTALTRLGLAGCRKLTSDGMMALAPLTALTDLNLKQCQMAVTDEGMRKVAKLSSLTSLNLAFCKGLLDKDVATLTSLTNLAHLNLGACSNVTNEGMRTEVGPLLISLTTLTWPDDPRYCNSGIPWP
jgi:Leucine-rich repeat (LRR) protein